jgi:hypothetical protein
MVSCRSIATAVSAARQNQTIAVGAGADSSQSFFGFITQFREISSLVNSGPKCDGFLFQTFFNYLYEGLL